ncbi:MAG: hypothetical protein GY903_09745, partial [Fuerstiella sp.]|nr:hypothetical protein [Fuerstiella sp.]
DVDSDSITHIKITTLETAGTLFLDADDDDTYDSNEDVEADDEIAIGSITNLGFVSASNANGNTYATFKFKVKDGTAYSSGEGTNTMNVAAANDLPTSSAVTVSGTEDTLNTYTSGNFAFSDVDSGDSLSRIKITSLESTGDLECQNKNGGSTGWADCVADDYVSAGTDLRLTPASDSVADVTFSFMVFDGTAYSASAYVVTTTFSAVNDAPAFSAATTSVDVAENQQAVGTYTATDAESDTITYSKSGTDSDLFALGSSDGVLTFSSAPNFEAPGCGASDNSNTCTVIITATATGGTDTNTITVTVTNVNDNSPTDMALSATSAAENAAAGTDIGTLSTTDADASGNAHVYTLVTDSGGATAYSGTDFSIDSAILEVGSSPGFNYDSGTTSYTVYVKVADGSNTAYVEAFTI